MKRVGGTADHDTFSIVCSEINDRCRVIRWTSLIEVRVSLIRYDIRRAFDVIYDQHCMSIVSDLLLRLYLLWFVTESAHVKCSMLAKKIEWSSSSTAGCNDPQWWWRCCLLWYVRLYRRLCTLICSAKACESCQLTADHRSAEPHQALLTSAAWLPRHARACHQITASHDTTGVEIDR